MYVADSQEMADEIIGKIGEVKNIDVPEEFEIIKQQKHEVHVIPLGDLHDGYTRSEVEAILQEYFVVNRIENLHYFNLRIMN